MIRPLQIGGAVLGACALAATLPAQDLQGPALIPQAPNSTKLVSPAGPAPAWLLDRVDLFGGDMVAFDAPTKREAFQMSMSIGGSDYLMSLQPNDLRGPNYQLLVDDGNTITAMPRSESVTWRGIVLTQDGPIADAAVSVSIVDGAMDGMIHLGGELGTYFIEPTQKYESSMPAESHIVYHRSDIATAGACGVDDRLTPVNTGQALTGQGLGGPTLREAEIAFDADFDLYQLRGSSVPATESFITAILNNIDAIYINDVDITYVITTILVRTAVTYTSTSAGGVLNQFSQRWNSQHGSIQRDLAHLFSGKTTFGSTLGIASLATVCNIGNAYGVNDATISTGALTAVHAHECGHNWSATHCNATPDCRIMCSAIGGCGPITSFGPTATGQIISFKNSRTCLTIPPPPGNPPVITSIVPSDIQALPNGAVTINGTDFTGVTTIFYGIQTVTPLVFSDTMMTFVPPTPTNLGSRFLIAENQAGTSGLNFVNVVETSPPNHSVSPITFQGSTLNWGLGGGVGDSFFLVVNFNDPTTIPVLGVNLLANPIVFTSGALDVVGLSNFAFPIVTTPDLTGVELRSQIITIDPATLAIQGSNPTLTTIF
ncbi:MAG: M12 family metallo-peptidase [Planctomycetota bacterium]